MPSVALDRDVIRPAFLSVPPTAVGSLGDEAAELAIALDQQVDEEERIALRALMPIQANGMPAGLEGAIACGRRQVKSWALEQAVVHDSFVTRVHRVVWTAHLTETSDDNFEHLCGLLESYDWLRKRVRRIYRGNGDHRIMLTNGGRIEFGARESGTTGRGRDVNRLILDEWLFGTAGMLGAMVPMLGGVKDRYIRYGSSPGLVRSEALRSLRDRGRRGGDPSLSWCEWTSERMRDGRRILPRCADPDCLHVAGLARGCFLDDEGIRREVNPAYGRRLTKEFVSQERLAMPPVEYMRERCGIWEDPPPAEVRGRLFPLWPERSEPNTMAPEGARFALAVDTNWDRSMSYIAAALELPDGRILGQLVASGAGTGWVPKWFADRIARKPAAIALVASGAPVSSVHDDLLAALPAADRARVRALNGTELAQAAGHLFDRVAEGGLVHHGQHDLDSAIDGAVSRPMAGGAWALDRVKSECAPAVALSEAVWALNTAPAPVARSAPRRLR